MKRKTFDKITTLVGLVLAVVLAVAGGLLLWGGNFANTTVHNQLAAQKIYFPAKDSDALKSPEIGPYLDQYAGQQLLTGAQAKAWADHYIAVHLQGIGGGKTYSELSAQSMANPTDTALAQKVQTVFRGETLRGLLLNAYAFGTMGTIAFWGAIASFVGAAFLFLLSLLGLRHERHVPAEQEVRIGRGAAAAPAVG